MNKSNYFLISLLLIVLSFSCEKKDERCLVPIIFDSLKCYTNVKDTFSIVRYDTINFFISYYQHLASGYWCLPAPEIKDFIKDLYIITNTNYGNYLAGDTINNITNNVIYYEPKVVIDKDGTHYLYGVGSKKTFNSIDVLLLAYNNKIPVERIQFRLCLPPDTIRIFSLKCIVYFENGKIFIQNFKPIRVRP